jgi:hypothetical protein
VPPRHATAPRTQFGPRRWHVRGRDRNLALLLPPLDIETPHRITRPNNIVDLHTTRQIGMDASACAGDTPAQTSERSVPSGAARRSDQLAAPPGLTRHEDRRSRRRLCGQPSRRQRSIPGILCGTSTRDGTGGSRWRPLAGLWGLHFARTRVAAEALGVGEIALVICDRQLTANSENMAWRGQLRTGPAGASEHG